MSIISETGEKSFYHHIVFKSVTRIIITEEFMPKMKLSMEDIIIKLYLCNYVIILVLWNDYDMAGNLKCYVGMHEYTC